MTLQEFIEQQSEADAVFDALVKQQDYEGIAAFLNKPTVIDNPSEPEIVSQVPTLDEVLAIVPSVERVAIRNLAGFVDDVRRAIDTKNLGYMEVLIEDALTANAISTQTAAALEVLLERTQPDPSWSAVISGPSLAQSIGIDFVTGAQVQAAIAW